MAGEYDRKVIVSILDFTWVKVLGLPKRLTFSMKTADQKQVQTN